MVAQATELRTQVAELRGQNLADVAAFHEEAYGHGKRLEHWTWEYEGTHPARYVFALIRDGKGIIATQGMIPVHINIAGKRVLTGKSESTLLDPRHRGGTLFRDFYEFAVSHCRAKGMQCLWGFTPAASAFARFGFRAYQNVMGEATCLLSAREPRQHDGGEPADAVKGAARRIIRASGYAYGRARLRGLGTGDARLCVREKLFKETDLHGTYSRLREANPGLIHLELDKPYLQWRVRNHPIFTYRQYFVYDGDLLCGYAFVNAEDEEVAYLTDLTFESTQAGKVLLARIITDMRAAKVRCVTYFGNRTGSIGRMVFGVLRTFGFMLRKTRVAFVVRNLSCSDERILLDPTNWHLSGLWTEGFQM